MKRSLGKGKGFQVIQEYSLIDENHHPELLDQITDRVAILYDMLYEDEPEETPIPDFTDEDWEKV